MPDGWKKPDPGPKKETILELQPDGSYKVLEREIPGPQKPPETVTIIDMKPDSRGVFVAHSIGEYYVR
jgi:hypothetical protein